MGPPRRLRHFAMVQLRDTGRSPLCRGALRRLHPSEKRKHAYGVRIQPGKLEPAGHPVEMVLVGGRRASCGEAMLPEEPVLGERRRGSLGIAVRVAPRA